MTAKPTVESVVERIDGFDSVYEQHLFAASYENWKGHAVAWRQMAHEAAALIESLQRQSSDLAMEALSLHGELNASETRIRELSLEADEWEHKLRVAMGEMQLAQK